MGPSKGRDLGTYHVRCEFLNRDGFIMEWRINARYTNGRGSCSPLDAFRIEPVHDGFIMEWPVHEDEESLIDTIKFMFGEGNYSCDCNRALFLADAHQEKEPELECGETPAFEIARLTLIRPDGSEVLLYASAPQV